MPEFDCSWENLNRPQQEYLANTAEYLLLSAGFGTGKTTADAVKVLQLAAANPGVPGMVAAQSWTALETTILHRLRKITGLPITVCGKERAFSLDGSTPIYARTAEAYKFADGTDVGWFVGDEARHWTIAAWNVFKTRARIPCPMPQTAISSTPVVGWLSDEFDRNLVGHDVVFGSTIDNADNLKPTYVTNLMSAWSRRMQQAALHGQFVIMEGAVFETFDSNKTSPWIVDYDEERWRQQPCQLWIDPGFRRSSVLWVREHPTEPHTWVVFDQQMPENMAMNRVVADINAIAKKHKRIIGDVVVDPAAKQADQATEVTLRQVIKSINRVGRVYHLVGFYRGIEWGIERTRALLGDPEIGQPMRLLFSRKLYEDEQNGKANHRGIIRSLAGSAYPESRDGRAMTDRPAVSPLYTHAVDACRYGSVLLWLRNPQLRRMLVDVGPEKGLGYAQL